MKPMNKYRIAVVADDDPENPRKAWDNVGTMVCWHSRYTLGDEQPSGDPEDYVRAMAAGTCEFLQWLDEGYGFEDVRDTIRHTLGMVRQGYYSRDVFFRDDWPMYRRAQELAQEFDSVDEYARAVFTRGHVVLPLYLYDHSGLSISTGGFSCPWDSGQVGFIYVSVEEAEEEWGTSPKPDEITDEEFWERRLRQEVETYSQYLEGEVYGFVLEKARGYTQTTLFEDGEVEEGEGLEWEEVDSCWGFFGYIEESGLLDHLPDAAVEPAMKVDVSYRLGGIENWEVFETEEEL